MCNLQFLSSLICRQKPTMKNGKPQQIYSSSLDPKNEFLDSKMTNLTILQLLSTYNHHFNLARGNSLVKALNGSMISQGKGFFSYVYLLIVEFEDGRLNYECILKVPLLTALGEENIDTIIHGHNLECDFYKYFHRVPGFPIPEVYLAQEVKPTKTGLIIMQNFIGRAKSLDLFVSAKEAQVLNIARAIACFQFYARDEKRREWWMQKDRTMFLNEQYSAFIPGYYPLIENDGEIGSLIPKIRPLLSPEFGAYAIRELPKKYNGLTLIHGDFQPNNLLFNVDEYGKTGNTLECVIDWQLIFYGNPMFDLARFIVFSVDGDQRLEIEEKAYKCYYDELLNLYANAGEKVPFTFEQGLEMFEMILCQQTTLVLTYTPYIRQIQEQLGIVEERMPVLIKRCEDSMKRAITLIEKYGLERFEKFAIY